MITKKQKFRTGVGCIYWLLVATWSFSLQLLQKSSGRWEPEEEESWKHPMAADWFFIFYLDFFIPFSFPSRARTGNAVPDYLPGIKEADGGGVAVVLLLLQLQQSSTSPLPFSRHLCWSYCASFLRTKRRERDRGGATMMMTMHLPSTFVLLLCCEIEERISILQLVAHVYLCICDRSSWNGIFFLGEKKWDL